jgi:ribonuclease R
MLPAALSDDLCSLKPHVDRLAFTVDMYLRSDGVVERAEFYPSLIHSSARLNYQEVQELLEDTGQVTGGPHQNIRPELVSKLKDLDRLAKLCAAQRNARGAIDFESAEPKLVLDEQGKVLDVQLRFKTDATALVEEAMIRANETVAQYLLAHNEACVYRVHEQPLQAALDETLPTLLEFGYGDTGAPQSSFDIQAILDASRHKPEYSLISSLLLRAMRRAEYRSVFTTHFGLASKAYTHFTSPIRRYPDLMVHRLLKLCLEAEQTGYSTVSQMLKAQAAPSQPKILEQLDWICEHASEQERNAERATADAILQKLCEFFAERIGNRYEAVISGVNSYGFYVREASSHAEGFIPREELGDTFSHEPSLYRWIDCDTKKSYRLGQPLTVQLASVNCARKEIRFSLPPA